VGTTFARGVSVTAIKRRIKRAVNGALRSAQVRLISTHEERAIARSQQELIKALYGVYRSEVFPRLRDRSRRLDLLGSLKGTEVAEAIYLVQHLQDALDSGPGDVVEMGVAQGATSALLANEILEDEVRRLWLYDSFEGLSAPTAEDVLIDDMEDRGSMRAYAGAMANPQEGVLNRLESVGFPKDRTQVVAGFIDSSMASPTTVAFGYLDFDLYQPIRTGLFLLHPKTRPGSVLVIDDFRYFSAGVERAVKEFLAATSAYEMLVAPEHVGHFCVLKRKT
jgi:hypothetical protein